MKTCQIAIEVSNLKWSLSFIGKSFECGLEIDSSGLANPGSAHVAYWQWYTQMSWRSCCLKVPFTNGKGMHNCKI